jgi:hypothetical protein
VSAVVDLGYVGLPLATPCHCGTTCPIWPASQGQHTGRAITLTEGTNRLVGGEPDRIIRTAREVMAAPPRAAGAAPVGRRLTGR